MALPLPLHTQWWCILYHLARGRVIIREFVNQHHKEKGPHQINNQVSFFLEDHFENDLAVEDAVDTIQVDVHIPRVLYACTKRRFFSKASPDLFTNLGIRIRC